ncbi:MAG: RNA polymerase Rpb4 family protein [Candidatus Aenigmatarchaeota archaeon]|nr:RNA polymerase Rpb4 family protein [Candidatus Aenigmarchaeota archaeon]
MEIISEELIPDIKAKELLESREKEGELKFEQKNSLEILRKFVKLDSNKTDELIAELKKIEKLRDRQIIAIVNFLPGDREDLRAVLHRDYSSLTDEEIDAILKTVKRYS